MPRHSAIHHVSPTSLPGIRRVAPERPFTWLADGLGDFARAPGVSLAYGFLVTAVMLSIFTLLQSIEAYYLAVGIMAGFALLGPLLAVGLYEVSRRLQRRETVTLSTTWNGWARNSNSTLAVGVILVLVMLTWFMLSMQLSAVLYGMSGELAAVFGNAQDWVTFLLSIRWPMVAAFLTTGTIAAIVAFVLSVVSIPMLTEKEDMDVITAMVASWHAVKKNGDAMLVWAMIIGFLTALAVAPLFLGLIVVFPLLGYASWHAYQDLIEH
jgi:uncharacterized membrane protein